MHDELGLVINITAAVSAALIGGLAARKLGLPALVGYLLAGLAIGPFTPGFVGNYANISQLAEMGVIFMMFGVGLHFSLGDLWRVRNIAIPGAILQMAIAAALGWFLAQQWGWSMSASLVLGFAISIASTVVLLRGLVDNGLLNTIHGQIAVGWLVLEDLATIIILVLLPAVLGAGGGDPWQSGLIALGKTAGFVLLMLLVGSRVMPWILTQSAYTRSKELFILAVIAVALGTALGAAMLFGVSLALGAFLAGAALAESRVCHHVEAEVSPFRELFTVLFFVSVGMLVDPYTIFTNPSQILLLTLLIVVGKAAATLILGFILPASAKSILVVAAGLSQIGEFSFIIGQTGLHLGVLSREQYSLILTGSLVAIVFNPLLFQLIKPMEKLLQRLPGYALLNKSRPVISRSEEIREGHVVIVGYGRVGTHLVSILRHVGAPHIVVEQYAERAEEFIRQGTATLLGDASNSGILKHAHLDKARALVITIPNENTVELIVTAAHEIAPQVPIIARASTTEGMRRIKKLGARHVIHPEFEGALEVLRHTLLTLDYSIMSTQRYADAVKNMIYGATGHTLTEHHFLDQMVYASRQIEIAWHYISARSPLIGQSIAGANVRAQAGVSIFALLRQENLVANPPPETVFEHGDMVGLLGDPEQILKAQKMFSLS